MTIGTRLHSYDDGAYRTGHTFGNRLFIWVVRVLFGVQTRDLFSGYRAFTQRFLALSPLIAQGFELEAELSMQALAGAFVVTEVPIHYRARGEGRSTRAIRRAVMRCGTFSDPFWVCPQDTGNCKMR